MNIHFVQSTRIQQVLNEDSSSLFCILESGESLRYVDYTLILSNGTVITDILSLTVENLVNTKQFFRLGEGDYFGYGKITILKYT